jgi:hypothetical protein
LVSITLQDGNLIALPAGQQSISLVAVNETTFRPNALNGITVTFNVEGGKTVGFELCQGSDTMQHRRIDEMN